jgi:hypothetical protein
MRAVVIVGACVAAFLLGWAAAAVAFIMAVGRWLR